MIRRLLVTAALALWPPAAWAQPVSGAFGDLTIGVDPASKTLTGFFENYTGWDPATQSPRFSCIFYLRGRVEGPGPYPIKTWFPGDTDPKDVIEGVLEGSTEAGLAVVSIRLKAEHGGCWNVQQFENKTNEFTRDGRAGAWREVRVVSSKRAYFYDAPMADRRRAAYLVEGDGVRVMESSGGWARVEYVSRTKKQTTGWIKEADLYSSSPPG